jgi:hypothetical protein
MWEDPIVAEVHRIREELAAKFNYDIKAIFADMRKRQAASGVRLVFPKKEEATVSESGPDAVPQSTPSKSAPAA